VKEGIKRKRVSERESQVNRKSFKQTVRNVTVVTPRREMVEVICILYLFVILK